eukprot:11026258-Heterocapsa_arctica.AAC.1
MEFIETHPYPEYEVVASLLLSDRAAWGEYGEFNHGHVRYIYENIYDVEEINGCAQMMVERKGFPAIDYNFFVILR